MSCVRKLNIGQIIPNGSDPTGYDPVELPSPSLVAFDGGTSHVNGVY